MLVVGGNVRWRVGVSGAYLVVQLRGANHMAKPHLKARDEALLSHCVLIMTVTSYNLVSAHNRLFSENACFKRVIWLIRPEYSYSKPSPWPTGPHRPFLDASRP